MLIEDVFYEAPRPRRTLTTRQSFADLRSAKVGVLGLGLQLAPPTIRGVPPVPKVPVQYQTMAGGRNLAGGPHDNKQTNKAIPAIFSVQNETKRHTPSAPRSKKPPSSRIPPPKLSTIKASINSYFTMDRSPSNPTNTLRKVSALDKAETDTSMHQLLQGMKGIQIETPEKRVRQPSNGSTGSDETRSLAHKISVVSLNVIASYFSAGSESNKEASPEPEAASHSESEVADESYDSDKTLSEREFRAARWARERQATVIIPAEDSSNISVVNQFPAPPTKPKDAAEDDLLLRNTQSVPALRRNRTEAIVTTLSHGRPPARPAMVRRATSQTAQQACPILNTGDVVSALIPEYCDLDGKMYSKAEHSTPPRGNTPVVRIRPNDAALKRNHVRNLSFYHDPPTVEESVKEEDKVDPATADNKAGTQSRNVLTNAWSNIRAYGGSLKGSPPPPPPAEDPKRVLKAKESLESFMVGPRRCAPHQLSYRRPAPTRPRPRAPVLHTPQIVITEPDTPEYRAAVRNQIAMRHAYNAARSIR